MKCNKCGTEFLGKFCPNCGQAAPEQEKFKVNIDWSKSESEDRVNNSHSPLLTGWKQASITKPINISNEITGSFHTDSQPPKVPFYQKFWFIALMCLFFPYIAVFLVWTIWRKQWRMSAKIITSVVLILYIICIANWGSESENSQVNSDITTSTIISSETEISQVESSVESEDHTDAKSKQQSETVAPSQSYMDEASEAEPQTTMVWISSSGTKYHSRSSCSNMKNPIQITLDEAVAQGYSPCKKCH